MGRGQVFRTGRDGCVPGSEGEAVAGHVLLLCRSYSLLVFLPRLDCCSFAPLWRDGLGFVLVWQPLLCFLLVLACCNGEILSYPSLSLFEAEASAH